MLIWNRKQGNKGKEVKRAKRMWRDIVQEMKKNGVKEIEVETELQIALSVTYLNR